MIAEDTQPSAHGRDPQPRPGTTPDALITPAVDAPAGPTGRPAAVGPEGGAERVAAALKPRMRGWLHADVFPLPLVGGIVSIAVSRSAAAVAACSVYALSACLLFGTSGVYHRGTWGPRGEAVPRRLDHANIFLIIAGTYTPLAVPLLPAGQQRVLLTVVWAGALAGIGFRILWIGAPRWSSRTGRCRASGGHRPGSEVCSAACRRR
jgi:hemolysin III